MNQETRPPMSSRFDKVCIVGAGAIGGWLGAGLARAGCHVSMLARGQTLAALQQGGLQLHSGPAQEVRYKELKLEVK